MSHSQARFNAIVRKLQDNKYKMTPQRLAVIQVLSESKGHPSVEHIHKSLKKDFPTISLATVYRTVMTIKSLGEVLELGFADGSNRYDGKNPDPHPHIVCIKCRKIIDPDLDSLQDMTKEVAEETGFTIISHRLDFFGICPECG
jgi:Fur family transcriptional regulator, peroxide stress response regulator